MKGLIIKPPRCTYMQRKSRWWHEIPNFITAGLKSAFWNLNERLEANLLGHYSSWKRTSDGNYPMLSYDFIYISNGEQVETGSGASCKGQSPFGPHFFGWCSNQCVLQESDLVAKKYTAKISCFDRDWSKTCNRGQSQEFSWFLAVWQPWQPSLCFKLTILFETVMRT